MKYFLNLLENKGNFRNTYFVMVFYWAFSSLNSSISEILHGFIFTDADAVTRFQGASPMESILKFK